MKKFPFLETVSTFTDNEKLYLLNILKEKDIGYSKNTNGYFFNLKHLDDPTINSIKEYINTIVSNRDIIQKQNQEREEREQFYKDLVKDTFDNNGKCDKVPGGSFCKGDLKLKLNTYQIGVSIIKKKKYEKKTIDYDTSIDLSKVIKTKFKKNTVYHRLCSAMKRTIRNKSSDENTDSTDVDYSNVTFYGEDVDAEFIEGDVGEDHDENIDLETLDHDIDNENVDHDVDNENVDHYENNDTVVDNDIDNENEDEEMEIDEETLKEKEEFEHKLKQFKEILSTKGYEFTEVVQKLKMEEYI
jgi:hypothetical protein